MGTEIQFRGYDLVVDSSDYIYVVGIYQFLQLKMYISQNMIHLECNYGIKQSVQVIMILDTVLHLTHRVIFILLDDLKRLIAIYS